MKSKADIFKEWELLIDRESMNINLLDSRGDQDMVQYFRHSPEWREEPPTGRMRIFRRLTKSLSFPGEKEEETKLDFKPYLSPV